MVGRERSCSVGLKLALANMIPSLVAAFIEIGAEGCEEFQKMRVSLPLSLNTTQ
jgi:ubiquitin-conjugating enzyme E2 O